MAINIKPAPVNPFEIPGTVNSIWNQLVKEFEASNDEAISVVDPDSDISVDELHCVTNNLRNAVSRLKMGDMIKVAERVSVNQVYLIKQ